MNKVWCFCRDIVLNMHAIEDAYLKSVEVEKAASFTSLELMIRPLPPPSLPSKDYPGFCRVIIN